VARDDVVVLERYASGTDGSTLHPVFSASKSLLSLIVGGAVERGDLTSLDDSVTKYLPELGQRDARFERITLAHLLDMRSGLKYRGTTSFPFITGDAPLVYYASDLRQVVLAKTQVTSAPGDTFHYNDYNPNLVALALERAVGEERMASMRRALWSAVGAAGPARWSTDDRGFPYYESGFVAAPLDLARVGRALIDEVPSAVLSPAWRDRMRTVPVPATVTTFNGRQRAYRAGWWVLVRPDGRHDLAAIGRFGQFIYVSPAHGVIIVRTGGDRRPPSDNDLAALFYEVVERIHGEAGPR
jgi:CubicO group peptidase (beta-lactamase class C family)